MNIIEKYLDYKRRKELDKRARDLWTNFVDQASYSVKEDDIEFAVGKANKALTAFYDAFYPRIKS